MSLLFIDVSIRGDYSISRGLGKKFLETYKEKNPDVPIGKLAVVTFYAMDLAANPPPHLDMEGLMAGWTPEDARTPEAAAKHNYRLALIKRFKDAKSIVITTPMFNWGPPSLLKALIDQIIMPNVFDSKTKPLEGKPVTVLIASGGGYSAGSGKEGLDFLSKYLESVFSILGSTDISVIRSEFAYAKFGVAELNDLEIKSNAQATEATIARANAI